MNRPDIATAADPLDRTAELESITRDYARYDHSAGGLSAMLGGALCLLSFGIGAAFEMTPWVRAVLLAIPPCWLVSRHLVARFHYQRLGHVVETRDDGRIRLQRRLLGGVTAIVALILLGVLMGVGNPVLGRGMAEKAMYLALVAAMPLLAWRWLRTPIDLAIGSFLWCQSVLAAVGASYPLWSTALVFLPAALLMIAAGLRDHRRYRFLRERIRRLSADAGREA